MCRLKRAISSFGLAICLAVFASGCGSVPDVGDPSSFTGFERYGAGRSGEIRMSAVLFPGDSAPTVVEYEVLDGLAIYEGDIVLGRVGDLDEMVEPQALALRFGGLWADGVVPYIISGSLRPAVHRDGVPMVDLVAQAMAHWELNTTVRFIAVTPANVSQYPDHVIFYLGDGCAAEVGRKGGTQGVWLNSNCGFGAVVHEIGHTLGLMHEHSRGDRDDFVEIILDNVAPWINAAGEPVADGYHFTFARLWIDRSIGPYDYDSVMHYPSHAFANDAWACHSGHLEECTIIPQDGIDPRRIGQRSGLSACDVTAVGTMYGVQHAAGCPGPVLAGGFQFSLAIAGDGSVWGWGDTSYGQLGYADRDFSDGAIRWRRPERIELPAPAVSVSSAPSSGRSALLLNDGTVYTMGPRWSPGTETIGYASSRAIEVQRVMGLSDDVQAIDVGFRNNLAVHRDGTVSLWSNVIRTPSWPSGWPQHGDGIDEPARKVDGLSDVMAVAAGSSFQLALRTDGTVVAWGSNFLGQLGDGTTIAREHPAQVPHLAGVIAIAAGGRFAVALLHDGTLMTWGDGRYGQLGTGATVNSLTPQPVPGLHDVVAIAAGHDHALALHTNGTLSAWGSNRDGELGTGSMDPGLSATPLAVRGIDRVVAMAAGGYVGSAGWWSHSVALREDGTLWTWGNNIWSALGDGPGPSTATPRRVRLPTR